MTDIDVRCDPVGDAWGCGVRVTDGAREVDFEVTSRDPSAFLPPSTTPTNEGVERLVRETFAFLLEREAVSSILSRFDLDVVARYFPEYPDDIRSRLSR